MATTLRDVARAAGVSTGTVSNVLNGRGTVTEANRRSVLAAIDAIGYVRNESARQLRAGRSRILGLVVLDAANPFYADMARGVELTVTDRNLIVMTCDTGDDPAREIQYLSVLAEQRALGAVVAPTGVGQELVEHVRRLRARGTAVGLIAAPDELALVGATGECCSVCGDDRAGGRAAGRHLLEQGHRRIAYVSGPDFLRVCVARGTGLTEAAADSGLPGLDVRLVPMPATTIECGRRALEELAADGLGVSAVFCSNDLLALGVLQGAVERGIRVPEDLAIVGYDDIVFASGAAIPLTSVRQPGRVLGRMVAELMLEEIDDPTGHVHRSVVHTPELVVRRSTARAVTP